MDDAKETETPKTTEKESEETSRQEPEEDISETESEKSIDNKEPEDTPEPETTVKKPTTDSSGSWFSELLKKHSGPIRTPEELAENKVTPKKDAEKAKKSSEKPLEE